MSKSDDRKALELAVALRYDGRQAPVVSAKGTGETAQRIRELAQTHGVPLREDEDLVRVLAQVELGQAIPESLYRAVAELLAFTYALANRAPPGYEPTSSAEKGSTSGALPPPR